MKLKLLIAVLLIPFSAFGVQTNVFDNVLIRNNFQFTGGTPGLNKVLTSDATGKYTPQSLIALDATIITNATSSGGTVTITGQGTHILNLESVFPSFGITNINSSIPSANITWTGQGTRIFTPVVSYMGAGGFVTNNSSPTFGTVNGLLPANIVTNITDGTTGLLTFTGRGTRIYVPTINSSSTGVVTNGSSASVSQLKITGGLFNKFVTTGTNYTSSITDFMVQYRGTTATQVTNFLPAISTTITNGFTLVIKDGQRSAGTTNIVIFPNGTDTISQSTNLYINVNGGSFNLMVDGPNKNWITW